MLLVSVRYLYYAMECTCKMTAKYIQSTSFYIPSVLWSLSWLFWLLDEINDHLTIRGEKSEFVYMLGGVCVSESVCVWTTERVPLIKKICITEFILVCD